MSTLESRKVSTNRKICVDTRLRSVTFVFGACVGLSLLIGCSHTLTVRDIRETAVPLPDGPKTEPPVVKQFFLDSDAISATGRLTVTLSQLASVPETVRIERRGTRVYNPYVGVEWVVKPIVTPIGIGVFGVIFWAKFEEHPDQNGNGRYDLSEYFYDLSSWFNPFDGMPYPGGDTKTENVCLGVREEVRMREPVRCPAVGYDVRAAVQGRQAEQVLSGRTGVDGRCEFDLASALELFAGDAINVKVTVASSPVADPPTLSIPIQALSACEILRERFGVDFQNRLDPARQRAVSQLYGEQVRKDVRLQE